MNLKFIDVGSGNYVSVTRIISVASPESLPVRRMMQDAKNAGRAIDVTCGKKTKSVIITDSDHFIFSAEETKEIVERMKEDE